MSSTDGSITRWLKLLDSDDGSVARGALFERYFEQLMQLARQRLQVALRTAEDEEDVALGALDSFFSPSGTGKFPRLSNRNELWALLVTIASRKAINQAKRQTALKRGGGNGPPVVLDLGAAGVTDLDALDSQEPTPEMLVLVVDEFNVRLNSLNGELLREVAVLALQGCTNSEIAAQLNVSDRTVRRKLQRIRREWVETVED